MNDNEMNDRDMEINDYLHKAMDDLFCDVLAQAAPKERSHTIEVIIASALVFITHSMKQGGMSEATAHEAINHAFSSMRGEYVPHLPS